MKLRSVFLGKPIHWLPWPIIAGLFIWMNSLHLHVTQFNTFAFVVLRTAPAVVAYVVFTTGRDEQVTREPIPQDGGPAGTESEH
ncbi:MAG: hypothetical protein OEN48_00515 [Betaproteobacteria bacterium]|nr:hypothetical protein [Betaproteobacteria bacterium]